MYTKIYMNPFRTGPERISALNINDYLKQKKEEVETFLQTRMDDKRGQKGCPPQLREAMAYSLMAGGKRIRPIFCMASYEAAGGSEAQIIPVASAIELIHTYSLIHDDLPSMDNDDLRRNKPTNHKVFGEATAILAGDALLTDAFSIITETALPPPVLVNVISELSHACGPEGMVGGQIVDILLEGKKADREDIYYIHTHKTGALIRCAIRIGAIIAGAGADTLDSLTVYGEKVGLAFQIIDDILDVTGTEGELGKPTGSDNMHGKNTYPSLFGLEASRDIARELIDESIRIIESLDGASTRLIELARYILERRN